MALSETYYKSTLAMITQARPVTAKKMFGGAGLYCQDAFFAVMDDDRTYFKVDAESEPTYLALNMAGWGEIKTGGFRYREVPAHILAEPESLGMWIDAAVKATLTNKKKNIWNNSCLPGFFLKMQKFWNLVEMPAEIVA